MKEPSQPQWVFMGVHARARTHTSLNISVSVPPTSVAVISLGYTHTHNCSQKFPLNDSRVAAMSRRPSFTFELSTCIDHIASMQWFMLEVNQNLGAADFF